MTPPAASADARELIERLRLVPHPEGGWYRETWRAGGQGGGLDAVTAIHFLLEAGERSGWRRVDATEIWLHQAGGALTLSTARGAQVAAVRLGPDLMGGDQLQAVVEPGQWQSAQAGARWVLAACVVAPAFEFSGFEMAPEGWRPGGGGAVLRAALRPTIITTAARETGRRPEGCSGR